MRRTRAAIVVVCAAALTFVALAPAAAAPVPRLAPSFAVPATASPSVSRISGTDRYAMSVAASRVAFPTGTQPSTVYLVSGTSPYESLSATPAAVKQGGGVLLTRPDGIPSSTAAELQRLAPASIVVVGPMSAVSDTVLAQAAAYAPTVRRVGGTTRYLTANALVRNAFPAGSAKHAWIATGRVWTDGLVGGVAAAALREPLVTVDGAATTLPSATVTLLRDLGVTSVTVVGGTPAVSSGIATQLASLLGSSNVTRASGSDAYAVSASVNGLAFPDLPAGSGYVANAREPENVLAGALLAGRTRRPVYYTLPYCVPAPVRPALAGASVTSVVLLGREDSVRGLVGTLEPCRSLSTSSSLWVLVNKRRPLSPKTYVPSNLVVPAVTYANAKRLRSDAAEALVRMVSTAKSEGAGSLAITSGYRSYDTQYSLYWDSVSTNGQAYADKWIARPGYSEHQTGLTLDMAPMGVSTCSAHTCIASTPQGVWLQKNSWRFGYILRYESGSTDVTGYSPEPWHFRYVGTALAKGYHDGGWHTFEQFLGEPAAPTY